MTESRVKVTYAGPLLFLASGQWTHVLASLKERLPLRSLHWKSVSRPSVRSVQELDVEVVSLDSVRDEPSSQIPSTVLERPLLNIYFVNCEDAETYKNSIRKQIKDWHTNVTQRRNQEWLIVLVVRPEAQATGNRLFQRGTILDRIRADFNVAKRDRCVQLAWSVGSDDPAAWSDLISKMKEGIISSFDATIIQREEEVKRSEVQRQMPGWNFCTFFILKESVASSFEGMNLVDDAQIQYDELEASFFQVLKEKNLSWFGQLGGTAANDDSAPLLSITKKPYRDLILSNAITVFDFRSYLLARQCSLLVRLGQIAEAASKAERFITSFARTLRDNEQSLSEFFVESWMYCSALNVISQCEQWAQALALDSASLIAFHAVKGELLELARCQLDKIGVRKGYLPAVPPFSFISGIATPDPLVSPSSQGPAISASDLVTALRSQDEFDRLYITTTNQAIKTYLGCGRQRFALKLHASLAALEQRRGRFPSAHQVFTSLPSHYIGQRWASLEGFTLSEGMESFSSLQRPKDNEWATQALAFLRAMILGSGASSLQANTIVITKEDDIFAGRVGKENAHFIASLVDGLRDAANAMDKDHIVQSHPAFSINLASEVARAQGDEDGSILDLNLRNYLPIVVQIDEIAVLVKSGDGTLHYTTSSSVTLKPGWNTFSLSCSTPAAGLAYMEICSLRLGKVIFQYGFPAPSRPHVSKHEKTSERKPAPNLQLLRLPTDNEALDVRLSFPDEVILDDEPHLTLVILTGRNHITEAIVRIRSPGDDIQFNLKGVANLQVPGSLEAGDDILRLTDVQSSQTVELSIPYYGARLEHIKAEIEVDYTTSTSPTLRRKLKRARFVNTALPLAVNVHDYFRGKRLFSRFVVRCATDQKLFIRNAVLQCKTENPNLRIVRCRDESSVAEVVSPFRPVYHVFMVESTAEGPRTEPEMLLLTITYRALHDEIQDRVTRCVREAAEKDSSLVEHRAELWNIFMEVMEGNDTWLGIPNLALPKRLQEAAEPHITALVPTLSTEAHETLSEVYKSLLSTTEQSPSENPSSKWRTLSIPVDLPFLNILNTARITAAGVSKDAVYSGQPLEATLTITTSFHWGMNFGADVAGHTLRFDVIPDGGNNWLVSGHKRGEFFATDEFKYETRFTLIPLRHGSLPLPRVHIEPVTNGGQDQRPPSCETHQAHAAERITIFPRSARSTYIVSLS